MSESTGKPEKIRIEEILDEGGSPSRAGDEDAIIEVVSGAEPGEEPSLEAPPGAGSAGASEGDSGSAQVEERLTEALREKDRIQDMYLRARADLENYRKRVERERDEDRLRITAAVAQEILPALDNLDRALAAPVDSPGFRDGVALIRRQMEEGLRKLGIEPIDSLGEPFDPIHHEAVAAETREGFVPNTVVEEIRKGYALRGRVLRPALVKVVQAHPSPADSAGVHGDDRGTDHRD